MLLDEWPTGMSAEWPHFSEDEMACQCGCGKLPEPVLMRGLEEIREAVGFPIPITSGARCPDHNAKVSRTGRRGPHTTGLAADLGVSRGAGVDVLRVAAALDRWTGFGFKQTGGGRFLHIDMIPVGNVVNPRPALWSY